MNKPDKRGHSLIEYDWKTLSDNQFEDLCKDLLNEAGVEANRVSGPGSGDMGRDVVAEEKIALKIGAIETFKILVQCKNYGKSKTTISPDDVETYAKRALTFGCSILLIITSHDLSAPAKTISEMISQSPSWNVKVSYWTEADLVGRLMRSPHLSEKYFGSFPHSKKIKCNVENSGFMWVPVKVTCENKTAQTRLVLNLSLEYTSIPSTIAEQLGIKFDPPQDFGSLLPSFNTNTFTPVASIFDTKILKDAELAFELLQEPPKHEFYRIKLEQMHTFKDMLNLQAYSIEPSGFLGLDVLRNFSISMKDGMLYPE